MKRLIAIAVAVLVAASASVSAQQKAFSIVTGTTGGVYFPLGGGLAQILTKHAGINANVEATAGSAENLFRIAKGQADLAFAQTDAAWDAVNGLEKFAGNKMGIRALMVIYPNAMHLVTIEGSGINTIADLRGKRVSTGPANSATEIMAIRAMQAVGIDPDKDVKRARLSPAESTRAIRDRQLDAYWFVGGVPTPAISDLAATPGIKIKLIDYQKEALASMVKTTGPIYVPLTIPAKSYPGQDTPSQTVAVWNILAVRDDMSVEMAYNITKAAYEQRADLAAVHPEGRNIDIKWQLTGAAVIPFHPGAIKFWAEQGVKLK